MRSTPIVALLAVTLASGCTTRGDAKVGVGIGLGIALLGGVLAAQQGTAYGEDLAGDLLGGLIAITGGVITLGSLAVVGTASEPADEPIVPAPITPTPSAEPTEPSMAGKPPIAPAAPVPTERAKAPAMAPTGSIVDPFTEPPAPAARP